MVHAYITYPSTLHRPAARMLAGVLEFDGHTPQKEQYKPQRTRKFAAATATLLRTSS